ncbi:MAG TPA: preprotein translocase subunit SecG, partial [Casimicrobiaceae bacterium]|nr:preprotein translocase subunit SecG [Casimicrobiaceae bacterium]
SSLGLTYLASTRSAAGPGEVMKQGVMQKAPEPATKAADVPAGTAPATQPAAPAPAKDSSSKAADVPK